MDSDEMIQARREALTEEARGYQLRLARAEATGDTDTAAKMRERLALVNAALGSKPDEPVQRRPRRATEKRA